MESVEATNVLEFIDPLIKAYDEDHLQEMVNTLRLQLRGPRICGFSQDYWEQCYRHYDNQYKDYEQGRNSTTISRRSNSGEYYAVSYHETSEQDARRRLLVRGATLSVH